MARRSRRGLFTLGGLAVCVFVTGCASLSPQRLAAHKIADALPGVIGPARHYEVQVSGDAMALTRGRARSIHVAGRDVQVAPDATLDTVDLVAQDVSFDTKSRRLDHVGHVDFVGTLGQEHLDAYLAASNTHPGLAVTLGRNDLQVRLPVDAGPIHTHVTVVGQAAPADGGSAVDFIADRAHLSILPVPVFLVNEALKRVNPVIDLSHFKVPLALQSTRVENHALVLRGTADLDALTASSSPAP